MLRISTFRFLFCFLLFSISLFHLSISAPVSQCDYLALQCKNGGTFNDELVDCTEHSAPCTGAWYWNQTRDCNCPTGYFGKKTQNKETRNEMTITKTINNINLNLAWIVWLCFAGIDCALESKEKCAAETNGVTSSKMISIALFI